MHAPGQTAGLVEYNKLLHAIAKHLYPDPVDFPGLAGVAGKHFFEPSTGVYLRPAPLSAEDQTALRDLIGKHADSLPILRAVMGEQDIESFRNAFRNLAGRPDWEPILRTKQDSAELRQRRGSARLQHDAALQKAITQGRIRHFDIDRVPTMPHFDRITYVPWEDAQAYLAPLSLDLGLLLAPARETASPADSAPPRSPNFSLVGVTGGSLQREAAGRRHWSAQDRLQVIESVRSGQPNVAAKKFGISVQYARQLASRFEKEAAAKRPSVPELPAEATTDDGWHLDSTADATVSKRAAHPLPGVFRHSADGRAPKAPRSSERTDRSESARNSPPPPPKVVLRMPEVERRVGLKRSSIYERLNPRSKYYDASFPRQVSLTGDPLLMKDERLRGGAVGFIEVEIEKWIAMRPLR